MISTETLAAAFAETAFRRREAGEPRYVALIDDGRFIGYNGAVKSRSSAARLLSSPDLSDWAGMFPYNEYGYDHMEQEDREDALSRLTIIAINCRKSN